MSRKKIHLDFHHGLSLTRAEAAVERLAGEESSCEVTLDFQSLRHVEVGAAWRLGNALRPISLTSQITVQLPGEFSMPPVGRWYKHLTHSGLGLALAKYGHEIRAGSKDITDQLRSYYSSPRGGENLPVPAWSSPTLLLVPSLHRNTLPADNPAHFNQQLRTLLAATKLDTRIYSRTVIEGLFQLLYEAVQNVWDHADRTPLAEGTEISSHFAVRYFKVIQPPSSLTSEFNHYLERISKKDLPEHEGFIEITVLDDGVGIAARQSRTMTVYRGTFDNELRALQDAFKSGGSVKLVQRDATLRGSHPGYGFAKITAALERMSAFAMIRTGRALAFFDGTEPGRAFKPLEAPFGALPGSVCQLVFPRKPFDVWSMPDDD